MFERLSIGIRSSMRTRRQALIHRGYDRRFSRSEAMRTARARCPAVGPQGVARTRARLGPASRYSYFRLGYCVGRGSPRTSIRVRLGYIDAEGIARSDPGPATWCCRNHSSKKGISDAPASWRPTRRSFLRCGRMGRIWPLSGDRRGRVLPCGATRARALPARARASTS